MTRRSDSPSTAPLFAWSDALRTAAKRRSQLRKRLALAGGGIAVLLANAALPPTPRLVWNASASAPIGLYAVAPGALIEPGDMVVARVPAAFRKLAAERRYVPLNVPLVKRVVAAAGDEICAIGHRIFVNGRPVANRRARDGLGRDMPAWIGCLRLRGRQLFLLMDDPASFDGRYFGATQAGDVVGRARLLWHR